jgi:hypothetical protein
MKTNGLWSQSHGKQRLICRLQWRKYKKWHHLHLPMLSVLIITEVVSLIPTNGEVFLIQHYVKDKAVYLDKTFEFQTSLANLGHCTMVLQPVNIIYIVIMKYSIGNSRY